jgi:hypothetical protein
MSNDFKTCPNCRTVKDISNFYLNRTGKKGNERQSYCKPCKLLIAKGYKARRRDKQRAIARDSAAMIYQAYLKTMRPSAGGLLLKRISK